MIHTVANGVKMKIWECFSGLTQQTWFSEPDSTIVLSAGGFCLDLTNGNTNNQNILQIWQCTPSDINQVWIQG